MWNATVSELGALPVKCHALDLPGFGSNNETVDTIEAMSDFVFSYMDHQQIPDAIVIGHSMGGYVALEMLAKQSDRINGVGLIHSHAAADSARKKDNRKKLISFIEKNGQKAFLQKFTKQLVAKQQANSALLDQVKNLVKGTGSQAIISASKAMIHRADHTNTLKANIPFLWIIGKEDEFMPYATTLSQANQCPIAEIHVLEDVGHLSMYEVPGKANKIILRFIEKTDASSH